MHASKAVVLQHRWLRKALYSCSCSVLLFFGNIGTLHGQVSNQQCPARYLQKVAVSGGGTLLCEPQADGVRWTIERPEVRRHLTVYPDIRFAAGDRVTVRAKGCVNTGTKPKMWKRYVDPYGNDTDRFYHGLIWIPGARIEHQGERLATPVGTAPVRITGIAGGMNAEQEPHPQEFVIDPPPAGIEPALRLGYESPHYRDDGYGGTAAGNGCEKPGVGHATVVISIKSSALPFTTRRLPLSFDPVSRQTDANGFMLAPQWAGNYNSVTGEQREALRECENFPYHDPIRVHRGIENPCSTQASFDVPSTFTQCLLEPGLGQLHGHVNWAPATYVGQLSFEDFSADGDLDFKLYEFSDRARPQRLGSFDPGGRIDPILTADSQGERSIFKHALWLEWAGYEITEHLSTGGWPLFQYFAFQRFSGMDKHSYDAGLRQKFFRKTAVATGLLGLDCVHVCHTELHPIYAMALRTRYECGGPAENQLAADGSCLYPEQKNAAILADDSWMLFVSNTGNEGSCARDEHYLYRDSLTVVLPAPPGATRAGRIIGQPSLLSNVRGLQWTWEAVAGGVAITVSLVPPSCEGVHSGAPVRIHGALHLNWSDQQTEPTQLTIDLGPKGIRPAGKTPEGAAPRSEPSAAPAGDAEPVQLVQDRINPAACLASPMSDEEVRTNAEAYGRQQRLFTQARDAKTRTNLWDVLDFVGSYTGKNLTVFGELQQFTTARDFALGVGARTELLQTPLGSLETEAVTTFPSLVASTAQTQFHVRTTSWLSGLRLQVARAGSPFLDVAKVGYIWRSTDSAASENTEFRHFKGHNFIIYTGAGFEPHRQSRVSLRVSGGMVFIPATGEKILRLSAGLHFRGRK